MQTTSAENILNKSENATPERFVIYIQNDANENVSECLKTGLCITVKVLLMLSRGKT